MTERNVETAEFVERLLERAKEMARSGRHQCLRDNCDRSFLSATAMVDHAESVHTFNDIERILSEHIREKNSKPSTRDSAGTYSWVSDIAEDWVVYTVESPKDISLFKSTYTIVDEVVTLGPPVEVRRRTVYDPVKKEQ